MTNSQRRAPSDLFVSDSSSLREVTEQEFAKYKWRMLLATMFCYLFLSLIHISEPTRPY